ncbi:MAG: hypothetical protein K9G57_00600 [Ignavibacteriales bacterium]|nr:hypothetical protein [Ignavibacteriales bacterium]
MLNLQKLFIDFFVERLKKSYYDTYSMMEPHYSNIIAWASQLSLENIANTNALYHNVEHTIMVTSVGQEILKGKHLLEGGVSPRDWMHFTIALLCHDIGFVRGICRADTEDYVATGIKDEVLKFDHKKTDASLMKYHVDRGKLFVHERFGGKLLVNIDADLINSYIEMTRFPIPDDGFHDDTQTFAGLARAADFIGQLGDPNYLRKIPALYYELHENNAAESLGYEHPGELRGKYAKFYWNVVTPYIKEGLRYLNVTQEGKQWVASLQSHVFDVEHGIESSL